MTDFSMFKAMQNPVDWVEELHRKFHEARIGEEETSRRLWCSTLIDLLWNYRHERFTAPPIGWFLFRICLVYWRLTCHPKLAEYGAFYEDANQCAYRVEQFQKQQAELVETQHRLRRHEIDENMAAQDDLYATCLDVLGLSEPFQPRDVVLAWRDIIMRVHPEPPAPIEQVQAANGAKDLIMKRNGW